METFEQYLETIQDEKHQEHMHELIMWVQTNYPMLKLKIGWNHPMFVYNETYIIGFSASSKHMAIAPEVQILNAFLIKIAAAGYSYGKHVFRIQWEDPIDYDLLDEIIVFTLEEKKDCKTFWLK